MSIFFSDPETNGIDRGGQYHCFQARNTIHCLQRKHIVV